VTRRLLALACTIIIALPLAAQAFDNFNGGIINTGAVTGVTSITNSGNISTSTLDTTGNAAVGGNLSVTGASTTNGITNTGNISTSTLSTTGNATIGGSLNVTGATTFSGALNTNNGLGVNNGFSAYGSAGSTGANMGVTATTASMSSANGFSSVSTSNNSVSLTADNDANPNNGGARLNLTNNSASMLVTNSATGNAHGLSVGQNSTVLSGGTTSTSLTLDDDGAHFASTGGAPARVTGVADGVNDFDAVNMRQFNSEIDRVNGGVASIAAMSNIPSVDVNKKYALGMGYGNFNAENALAIGGSMRVNERALVKASVGSSQHDVSVGLGAAFSW
jgi:hypothetical protein